MAMNRIIFSVFLNVHSYRDDQSYLSYSAYSSYISIGQNIDVCASETSLMPPFIRSCFKAKSDARYLRCRLKYMRFSMGTLKST